MLLEKSNIEPKFVLPGSDTSKVGAFYDFARSITRRAERSLVKFVEVHKRNDLDYCIKYLNRLSDLLFIGFIFPSFAILPKWTSSSVFV